MLKTITSGSWKTTSAGILAIIGALSNLAFAIKNKAVDQTTITVTATALLTGIGLMLARDNNKTSADVGIDTSPAAQAQRDAKKVS